MEKDLVDYEYLSDNARYADLFNGTLFGGEQVIMPEGLAEKDPRGICGEMGKRRIRTRDLKDIPSAFAQYVNDYAVHVVHARAIEDTSVFKTDLKQVFDFLKCAEDKDAMKRLVIENEEYRHLDMDAYDVMIAHAHSKELETMRDNFKEDDGDMCKALQDWAAEEREIGRAEGREEGHKEGHKEGHREGRIEGMKEVLLALVADGSLSQQRAAEKLNLSVEELQACMETSLQP